ncbi:Protein of unknown function [Geoalkalibacter ferrihydriticus]|uniref:Integron cassette protein n=2 Tax=Geoalkalibacter ferrihydriticus TaxID=392333 RepID=A0A0C2DPS5_9BACT|nr:DUF2442 domain-containing protein [Geoalkalibacter ferrihydriticus]KIH75379.1 hypothetical protein GFER_17055 [Geoalkalibacter ferrihydriticus DSM 17813]SDM85129.1 Protein of unknown function [Geoalkalibacter ferrihydriticus]
MQSAARGKNTSLEVTNISRHGFWLLYEGSEFFVPFEKFPWFRDVELKKIFNVNLESPGHFYWPDLDIDLSTKILRNPEKFELISRQ